MALRPTLLSASAAASGGPPRVIPGSYGLPLLGPLKDRLDYFWFQGPDEFFRRRMAAHGSTVFRTNMPPTFPFFVGVDPRVVALLDCASFAALFDASLVDKRDVLIGPYTPSLAFTGGTRVAVYLDPSEPAHARVKSFCLDLLRRNARAWPSEFLRSLDAMLSALESDTPSAGKPANFVLPLQKCIFFFLCRCMVGADPSADPTIAEFGFAMLDKWLALQLLPTQKVGVIPQPLEELLLHSFPFPFALVSGDYRKLYDFVDKHGGEVVRRAEAEYGLKKDEAINNILFVLGFNAFGGFSVFFPFLISSIGGDRSGLRAKLREEARRVLEAKELGFEAVREMELVRSAVYEVLRMKPPVPLQYGRARADFVLRSHDAAFQVAKGELLCGYQPAAMRDPRVFDDPDSFVPERFVGERGRALLQYLYWSNGPETGRPTTENKQCAAKDYVVDTACLLVAEMFRRYDDFQCDDGGLAFTKLDKATMAQVK